MKSLLRLATLLLLCAAILPAQQWREVFWSPLFNGTPLTGMPWSALTHIAHVNSEISNANNGALHYYCNGSANCSLATMSADAANVIGQAHSNGVLACMEVATGSGDWGIVTNPTNLTNFVNNTIALMNLGYDCLDIDWEGRAPYNQTQMIAMADALKAHIGSKPLSYAVFPNNYSSHQTMTNIQSHVDKFDVMTFDFSTTSPPTVFNSPINGQAPYPSTLPGALSLEWNYQDFVTRGMAASKLNFGYEANGYLLSGTTGPWQNVSASVAGTPLYRNIVSTYASQITNPTRDPIAQMPWFQVGSNEWLNYDDPTSIAAKAAWAKSKGVGLFQWEASGDFVNGAHPLLSAMGTSGGPPPTPTPPTITSASPLTNGSTGSAYSQTLGASGSTPITWSITSGTLPTGLSLNSSTGAISGTPASTGTATFTVKATNALGNNSQQFTLTINSSSGSPTITTSSPLPPGTVGVVYSQ